MTTTYEALIAKRLDGLTFSYSERDTKLYALSVGMGQDPLHTAELAYAAGGATLRCVPTQACVVARSNLLADAGLNRTKIVHGEQAIEIHRPLPVSAELSACSWIAAIHDKGEGKGALVVVATEIHEATRPSDPLVTLFSTVFARGDGGIGGPSTKARAPKPLPARDPDQVFYYQTSRNQALLYRLNGDYNPLHADPEFAARAGFQAPILHGLCTYGIACRALLARACDYDQTAMASFSARFTAPVFPGDRIRTDIWIEGKDVSFCSSVEERGIVALDFGACRLR